MWTYARLSDRVSFQSTSVILAVLPELGAVLKFIMEARLSGYGGFFYFTRVKLKHFL